MVRFSQNYGAQVAEGSLNYFKIKNQGAGSRESLDYFKKESKDKTYIIHVRTHDNTGPQTKHHGIFLSNFTIWELRKNQMPILIQIFGVLFSDFLSLFFSPKICTSLQNATHINCNICNSSCNKPKFSVTNFFLLHFCYTKCYTLIY